MRTRPFATAFLVAALAVGAALTIPALAAGPKSAEPKKGLTVDDLLAMQRISDPDASPDGRMVAFTVRDTDLEANKGRTDVWLASTDGAWVRRLTTHPDDDGSPRFSPDGKVVYFLSRRSGSSQIWKIAPNGSEAEQVSKLPLDVNGFVLFADGKRFVVALDVYPDAKTLAETVKRDQAAAAVKSSARAYDSLLFRHWDSWEDGKYSHLFVFSADEAQNAVDLTAGQTTDSPTHPKGGMEEVTVSPDGKTMAYVARTSGRENAWQTNTDVLLTTTDGKGKPAVLTPSKAYDFSPSFSPDGKTIAYRAMARPGHESDRRRLALIDVATKKIRVLTEGWDRSAGEVVWSKDGKTLWTTADHLGHHALFAVDVATGSVKPLVEKGTVSSPMQAGDRLLFARDSLTSPVELYTAKLDGTEVRAVTQVNAGRVAKIAWGDSEQFNFKGANGDTVWGYAMKPANWKPGIKAPVAFLIHGGPQGSFGDHFHYRWNPQAFAGHGYAVVFIDFHGSTGYGQGFSDAVKGDWGGAPYEDLMTGFDEAIKRFPWLDGNRAAALGASYGGYMVNWINGHTDRFKALVCHDGNLDERMAYFNTEELWFPEWEHGGTPWDKPESYLKHNPADFVKNWKTPTLVVHGGKDFRVVDTQGMGTFTALQRKGIASRFLHFPDENHWVLKPANSRRWHEEVLGWLDRYTAKK